MSQENVELVRSISASWNADDLDACYLGDPAIRVASFSMDRTRRSAG